jgi:hypothetical protein
MMGWQQFLIYRNPIMGVGATTPKPDRFIIDDIAHGLAYNCRWNGHTKGYWSVSQHSCMMYDMAPHNERLSYLFHDAEEAYWGDMIKPLKNILRDQCPDILERMKTLRKIIFDKFNIPPLTTGAMMADWNCLQWELENIIKNSNADYWLPEKAKKEWINRYNKIEKDK